MTEPTEKKATITLTVKEDDVVHDGNGGFLAKGAKVEAVDREAAESLKSKGYAA